MSSPLRTCPACQYLVMNVAASVAEERMNAIESAARRDERTKVLHEIREAAKPGYSEWPASDTEILQHVREVVEALEGGSHV